MAGDDQGTIEGHRIVYTRPGRGTGDTVYQTSNGDLWRTCYSTESTAPSTGEIRSTIQYPQ